MNFGQAIEALKNGNKVCRSGWNGKGMFLIYIPGTDGMSFGKNTPYGKADTGTGEINPHIDMFTADKKFQPGWLSSQTDMLAEDWEIV